MPVDVGALVLDADGHDVLPGAVGALDLPAPAAQHLEAAVPPLEDEPAAADREVLAGVDPAALVHVEVLDRAGQRARRRPGCSPSTFGVAVWCTRILHRPLVPDRYDARGSAGHPTPSQSMIGGPCSARPAGSGAEHGRARPPTARRRRGRRAARCGGTRRTRTSPSRPPTLHLSIVRTMGDADVRAQRARLEGVITRRGHVERAALVEVTDRVIPWGYRRVGHSSR